MTKERKPFTFNNYIMNQPECVNITDNYKVKGQSASEQAYNTGIDIRINNAKNGIHDYQVVGSPNHSDYYNS